MATTCIMRQLDERHVSTEADDLVWSPKMDLIAVSSIQGELTLHRLSWQKVWSLSPPTKGLTIQGLSWRPDGKVLAVGYNNGEVLIVDIENSETLHTCSVNGAVTSLNWVQHAHTETQDDAKPCYEDNSANYLPQLPSLSKSFGSVSKHMEENVEDAKKLKDQKAVNVLLVGTQKGKLFLFVFGLFPCGELNVYDYVGETGTIIEATISEDLNLVTLLLACEENKERTCQIFTGDSESGHYSGHTFPDRDFTGTLGREQNLVLLTLQTPLMACRHRELKILALKYGQISSLMSYMAQTIRSITEAWENILLEMDCKLASYAETVSDGSVAADFLDLLMFGVPSDELEKFLLHDLTEKGLKKLGHSIELSYSNIQKLVLKHLHSVGRGLVYHLAELMGMAKRYEKFGLVGLNEELVCKALTAAGAFMTKATEIQQVIDNSMKNFKAFFRWLYVVILRLSDEQVPAEINKITQQDLTFIAEFLKNFDCDDAGQTEGDRHMGFNLERVGQYLKEEELSYPPEVLNNPWAKFLEQNPKLNEHPIIIPHHKKKSLVQQHMELKQAVLEAFKKPPVVVGQSWQLQGVLQCFKVTGHKTLRISQVSIAEDSKMLLAVSNAPAPAEGFYLLEIKRGTHEDMLKTKLSTCIRCAYFYFGELNPDLNLESAQNRLVYRITDLQFYTQDTLSILLLGKGETGVPMFVQLSVKSILPELCTMQLSQNTSATLSAVPRCDVASFIHSNGYRQIENMSAARFAVSGTRKVAAILFQSRRRVRLFEMDVEEEEEEEEGMDSTNVTKESDSVSNQGDTGGEDKENSRENESEMTSP